jgi:hypothetical protein
VKNSHAWSTDRLEVNVIRQVANTEIDAAYLLEDNDSRIVQLVEAKWEDHLQSADGLQWAEPGAAPDDGRSVGPPLVVGLLALAYHPGFRGVRSMTLI